MSDWTNEEREKIAAADELEIASLRRDGTLRKPRTIWVVRVGAGLFVRSVNGRGSDWFRGVLTCRAGRVESGGVRKDVTFVEMTDAALQEQIDAAYRKKYTRYPKEYTDACLTAQAHAATLQLIPRG